MSTIDNKAVEERIKSLMADEKQEQYRLLRSQAVEELLAEANAPREAERVRQTKRVAGFQYPSDVWKDCPSTPAYMRPTTLASLAADGVYVRYVHLDGSMEDRLLCRPVIIADSGSEDGRPARAIAKIGTGWVEVTSTSGWDNLRRALAAAGHALEMGSFAPSLGPDLAAGRQRVPLSAGYWAAFCDAWRR